MRTISKRQHFKISILISESRKMQSAMEKCHFCFENVAKHLIVAIGMKVYLCLPAHRSMSDGHCLIVPMQHVSSGTSVDEDVWAEIQVCVLLHVTGKLFKTCCIPHLIKAFIYLNVITRTNLSVNQ